MYATIPHITHWFACCYYEKCYPILPLYVRCEGHLKSKNNSDWQQPCSNTIRFLNNNRPFHNSRQKFLSSGRDTKISQPARNLLLLMKRWDLKELGREPSWNIFLTHYTVNRVLASLTKMIKAHRPTIIPWRLSTRPRFTSCFLQKWLSRNNYPRQGQLYRQQHIIVRSFRS